MKPRIFYSRGYTFYCMEITFQNEADIAEDVDLEKTYDSEADASTGRM